MIEIEGLSKRFGAKSVLDHVSFTAEDGKVTGFLGPNGAGKSTTMRAALGLIAPDSGRALIDGRPFAEHRAPLRTVGAVLDAKSAHKGRSAYAHLLSIALTNGIPKRRVDEVMDLTGIAAVKTRKAGAFSLGMSQRLSIAAALLGDPHNLVLDEPINGLDPEGVKWVRDLCRYYAAQGRAVLLSSHLMSEVALTADNLVIIGQGRILETTTVADFVAEHSTRSLRVITPEPEKLRGHLRPRARGHGHADHARNRRPAGGRGLPHHGRRSGGRRLCLRRRAAGHLPVRAGARLARRGLHDAHPHQRRIPGPFDVRHHATRATHAIQGGAAMSRGAHAAHANRSARNARTRRQPQQTWNVPAPNTGDGGRAGGYGTRATFAAPRLTFLNALRAELCKALSLKSTYVLLIINALLLPVGSALMAWAMAFLMSLDPATGTTTDDPQPVAESYMWGSASAFVPTCLLVTGILGVMAVTVEYSSSTIQSSLTANPRRVMFLNAKTLVTAALAFVSSLVGLLLAWAAAYALLSPVGMTPLADGEHALPWVSILGGALLLTAMAVLGRGPGRPLPVDDGRRVRPGRSADYRAVGAVDGVAGGRPVRVAAVGGALPAGFRLWGMC